MRIRPLILLLAITLLAVAFFYMLQYQRAKRFGVFRGQNLVLVTIDTLRADHLPAYGYKNVKTPAIDKFASKSLIFEDAIAHTPMTLPSHASILTGLLPIAHGVRDNAGFSLDSKATTLAERLKDHEYRTAAFVSAFVLDSQFGLSQGFDVYSDEFALAQARVSNVDLYRRAEATQKHVDSWLQQNKDQKFFLWVHYYDPHDPYEPPEPFLKEYSTSPYDGEIAYTDRAFGKLQQTLQELGLTDKTIVVLTGDHGEGLGEHNERTHSLFIYNATQHVPLLVHLPGGKNRRIKDTVSHVDLVPTLMEWLGLPADPELQGRSMVPLLRRTRQPARAAYSESLFPELHYGWSPLRGLTTPSYKFIEAPNPELYDRNVDRGETRNIYREKPEIAEPLRKQLAEIIASHSVAPETAPRKVDPETEEKLKALGYVGTTVASTPESRNIDPKDKVELLEALSRAGREMQAGRYALVLEAVEPVLQIEPNNVDAHFLKATALLHLQKPEQALPEMLETLRLKPDHTQTLYNLAFLNQLQGRLQEAERYYLQLLHLEPEHLFGNLNLASIYIKQDARPKAEPFLNRIVTRYEAAIQNSTEPQERSALLEKLAEIQLKIDEVDESVKSLTEATALWPANYMAWYRMGVIFRGRNQLPEATEAFRKSIQANTEFPPAYFGLAESYLAANTNLQEALQLAETANRMAPQNRQEALVSAILQKLQQKPR